MFSLIIYQQLLSHKLLKNKTKDNLIRNYGISAQIIKDFRDSASTIEEGMTKEEVANELEKNYRQELARRQTLQFQKSFAKQLGYRNYDNLDDQTKNAIAKIDATIAR